MSLCSGLHRYKVCPVYCRMTRIAFNPPAVSYPALRSRSRPRRKGTVRCHFKVWDKSVEYNKFMLRFIILTQTILKAAHQFGEKVGMQFSGTASLLNNTF